MDGKIILDYLTDLEKNNNREWYHANRERYQEANREFEGLVGEIMLRLHQLDGGLPLIGPERLTFKLVRDTRFSLEKSASGL